MLDEISETPEFKECLLAEVKNRNLDADEVIFCYNRIYHVLSRWAHGHNNLIVIEARFHNDNERAGLAALMHVQDQWGNPLAWNEKKELTVEEGEKEGGNGGNGGNGAGGGESEGGSGGNGGNRVGGGEKEGANGANGGNGVDGKRGAGEGAGGKAAGGKAAEGKAAEGKGVGAKEAGGKEVGGRQG